MKLFIVVILAAVCGSAMCGPAEWEENAKDCSQKHSVKLDDVKDALHGKVKEDDVTPDVKCFFKCMAEKDGIVKDGTFQPQVLAEKLSSPSNKELLAKLTTECNLKGANDCDTSFKVVSCIAKNKMHKM